MNANSAMPESPAQQLATLTQRLLGSRQRDRALAAAHDWLSQDPENPHAHLAAAQALVNLQRHAEAEPHLTKLLATRPDHVFGLRLASMVCFHLKKVPEANAHAERATELQPNDLHNWYHLAWMRYQQGLREAAAAYAHRALELQPGNAQTINLIALCEKKDPGQQLAGYLRALEIDPENSIVHSNLGVYYLSVARDSKKAEACFRQALECDPMNRTAQKNLFAILRHRDVVYRLLTYPTVFVRKSSWQRLDRRTACRAGLSLLWLCSGSYVLVILAIWLLLGWPLVKAYEYLTLSDIQAKAGIVGARSGGWLRHRRWPFPVRLALFACLLVAFWGALWWFWIVAMQYWPQWLITETVVLMVAVAAACRAPVWWSRFKDRAASKKADRKVVPRGRAPVSRPQQPAAAESPESSTDLY